MTSPDTISDARRQLLEKLRQGELGASNGAPEPLVPRPPGAPAPLSPGQEQIWFHDQLATSAPIYNESVTIHKRGPLDPAILERCFNEIVRRHEIWRSAFPRIEGKVVQRIDSNVRVSLPLIDLSHLPVEEREREAVRIATEDAGRPFDLNVAPLFRVRLVRWAPDYHRVYLTVHHLVFDGVSIYRVLIGELASLYSAYSAGQSSPLPELAVQYGDYAVWKQHQLANGIHAAQLKYWRENLSEDLPSMELPTDRPRPAEPSWQGGMETFTIPAHLIEALKQLGRCEGVTPYMLLLAVFQVLLYRYSGQDEVIVGGAMNTRTRPEFEPLMGYFLNAVVFRSHMGADLSFREFLGRVRSTVLGALAHSEIPFDAIVRELAPKRDSSRHPLFQVLFSMRPPFADFPDGWDVTDMEVPSGASSFDLFVEFSEHPEGLAGRCVYSTDLFDRATIQRLLGNFQVLLCELVRNPDQAISRVDLLTGQERQTLLVDWNNTRKIFPSLHIHQLFEAQVERTPDHPALVLRGQQLTYAELNARANQLAHSLRLDGAASGTLVGVYMERSFEMVVALLAILKSGAAYVPYDPELPLSRLNMMLDDSRPVCVLTQQKWSGNLAGYAGKTLRLDAGLEGLEDQPDSNPRILVEPRDAIYAIYTSGSTGVPKAAVNTHQAVSNRILWMQDQYPLEASDRVLQKTPYSFDVSVWEFFWPISFGATLVIAEPGVHKDPAYVAKLIGAERITTIHFVPSMLREFLEAGNLDRCGSLQRVFASGEALSPNLRQKFYQRLGAELHNLYGPTEAAVDVTYWDCGNQALWPTVPIGRPISNVTAYILDRHLAPVPIGVAGELHIGGIAVARGYLNRPELTGARFIPDPFDSDRDARLYKTGDRARFLADGNIEYLGRLDDQVKLRGFRIELGEIESGLLQSDQVQSAVVALREDGPLGKRLVAYIVPAVTGEDSQGLRTFLKERLPDYMIPAQFVFLESLPRLPNGKVNRGALPAPQQWTSAPEEQYAAPSDAIERQLVDIWEALLATRPIGVNHNFFDLGGHSMLLARFLFRVERTFGQSLSMATVFQKPTIAQLAALLRDEKAMSQPCRVFPIQPEGTRPPLICLGAGPYFLPLARRLGSDQPLLGVDLTQLETDRLPVPVRLEDIGAHVAGAIRRFQPHGPYYLGGWCLYGVLMYEVAQQIIADGGEVALLVMIDSRYPAHKGTLPFLARMQAALQKWAYHATALGRLKAAEIPAYLLQRVKMLRNRAVRSWQRLDYLRAIQNTDGPLEMELDPVLFVACAHYRPQPYSGPVVLFQAVERPSGRHWDLRNVWHELIRGPFQTYDIVGGHDGMFKEPYVEVLGRRMTNSLEQAQKPRGNQGQAAGLLGGEADPDRFGCRVAASEVAAIKCSAPKIP
jgi:amino acid adenylation domain-containing protein